MDKRPVGRTGADSQPTESLVFTFPGYKSPAQPPLLQPNQLPNQTQQFIAPAQQFPTFNGEHLVFPVNMGIHNNDFRATPERSAPPTLGQIASRIKEKASASRRQSSEEMDFGGDDDDGEDDGGDDGDEEGGGAGGLDQSTGRWTKKEHELFLAALKKYGKEWKKVAQMVKTRTVVQTRTHAQKYFQKLAKSSGNDFSMDDDGHGGPPTVSISSTSGHKSASKRARRSMSPQDAEDYPMSYPAGAHHLDDGAGDDDLIIKPLAPGLPYYHRGVAEHGHMAMPTAMPPSALPLASTLRDLPQASPPTYHLKRKHGEMQAAQMLVSSSGANAVLDMEGAQMLSSLRQDGDGPVKGPGGLRKVRPVGLSLSIVNPGEHGLTMDQPNDPGTPWDSQIRALNSNAQSFTPSLLGTSSSSGNLFGFQHISVSTPAEQKQFISKVHKFVRNGDLPGLRSLLEAAVSSQNLYGASVGEALKADDADKGDAAAAATDAAPADGLDVSDEDHATNANTSFNAATTTSTLSTASAYSFPSPEKRRENAITRTLRNSEAPLLVEAASLDLSVFSAELIYEVVKLLLEHGVSVYPTDRLQQNTALHVAAQQGLDRVGRLLITKGEAPINALNKDGNAPVHLAAIAGHGSFLEMLASLGANFHLRNGEALSPIDLAAYASKDPGEREVLRRLMLSTEARLRTLVLYHHDFLEHSTRKPSDWEGPDRLSNVIARLRDRKEFPAYELEISDQFDKADVTLLGRVHSPEYLAFVNDLHKQVQAIAQQHNAGGAWDADGGLNSAGSSSSLGGNNAPPLPLPFTPQVQRHLMRQNSGELKNSEACDTSFSLGTLNAARRAAGAVAHGVDLVLTGQFRNVFCAVRPPGHHSGYRGLLNGADSCGFCIFNNVAAGALHALEEHKCERVAILDLDIHHGNGTEDIVKTYPHPSRLFFFSVHLYDHDPNVGYHFYPGTGDRNDYMHNIINVPINPLWRNPAKFPELNPTAATAAAAAPAATAATPGGGSTDAKEAAAVKTPAPASAQKPAAASTRSHEKTPAASTTAAAAATTTPASASVGSGADNEEKQLYGREAYRHAITHRLLPTLRAFHPDLILLSMGFDAAAGDVGNCRHQANAPPIRGMDLQPEDFAWATTEILKIADICCGGRVVSVLEGGYGEYETAGANAKHGGGLVGRSYATRQRTQQQQSGVPAAEIDAHAVETLMNRNRLAEGVAAHVHRLIDPYGPLRISKHREAFQRPAGNT